jgi:hypothetical protein
LLAIHNLGAAAAATVAMTAQLAQLKVLGLAGLPELRSPDLLQLTALTGLDRLQLQQVDDGGLSPEERFAELNVSMGLWVSSALQQSVAALLSVTSESLSFCSGVEHMFGTACCAADWTQSSCHASFWECLLHVSTFATTRVALSTE